MNRPSFLLLAPAALLLASATAILAEDQPAPEKSTMKDELKTLVIEDAKKQAAPAPTPAPGADKPAEPAAPATAANPGAPANQPHDEPAAPGDTPLAADPEVDPKAPPVVLPKVDVNRRKFTELDKLLQQQEKEMAKEAENAKSSELDDALNDDDVSFSILGGRSTQYREKVAKERLRLMSFEKDLIEAMAHTTDPEEKAEIKKYIQEIKEMRRDLEGSANDLSAGPR